jgi:hypothetical protein
MRVAACMWQSSRSLGWRIIQLAHDFIVMLRHCCCLLSFLQQQPRTVLGEREETTSTALIISQLEFTQQMLENNVMYLILLVMEFDVQTTPGSHATQSGVKLAVCKRIRFKNQAANFNSLALRLMDA